MGQARGGFISNLYCQPSNVTATSPPSLTMMSVTFLGTSSGGGPSESRNCSSLVCDVLGDGSLWSMPLFPPSLSLTMSA